MARYRIEFSRDWIRGRWGYIDRIFDGLGGQVTEPSRTENAWLVDYKGDSRSLGIFLSKRLELTQEHFREFGSIFEIQMVSNPRPNPRERTGRASHVRRLTAPRP